VKAATPNRNYEFQKLQRDIEIYLGQQSKSSVLYNS
jgi:hypothetical protein